MLEFLHGEGVRPELIEAVEAFRKQYPLDGSRAAIAGRVPVPRYHYYGTRVWEQALTALLAGENLLLAGPKATGKNVLAENLAAVFGRPEWDVSFYIHTDAASLIGTDTFEGGAVQFRHGPVSQCALEGGFGVLDEINMAKNESLAVLHATLDFRRIIEVPGYERIPLHPATRFIATMNYGYAGTRELNEALTSRFLVIQMPSMTEENLMKLLRDEFPGLKSSYASQFAGVLQDIQTKCDGGEISTRSLDLRGIQAAIRLVQQGLNVGEALEMGVVNKSFDAFERQLVEDLIAVRLPAALTRADLFE